jgi:hypothetical protein
VARSPTPPTRSFTTSTTRAGGRCGCDYLDIFTAPDLTVALKVSTIVRTYGHAHTEVWTATDWQAYKDLIRHLPAGEVVGTGEGI